MAKKVIHIFHISHVSNLTSIIANGCLLSDRALVDAPGSRVVIGMNTIKQRRLEQLSVHCHAGTKVGDYVPFYFCPRSPMLYMIHMRNAELKFKEGQDRIIHLVSTVDLAVEAAGERPWAFSDGNAGAYHARFRADLNELPSFVDWNSVNAVRWSGAGVDPAVKYKKAAEFLVHGSFPWTAIGGIGVYRQAVAAEVESILSSTTHKPQVAVKTNWYY